MTPSFALSLSFDGIRLLHRAAGGWRVVGDVALDTADLAVALADLRAKAETLAPDAVYTKLLLPNEQIKFLTIDTPDKDLDERRAAAALALDGATPYAVMDLAFDISVEGDQTHVAAVARETLAEAEQFAVDHQFRPLSFVAVPGAHAYLGEPFFGRTQAADALLGPEIEITPDGIAVVIIGDVEGPQPEIGTDTPSQEAEDTGTPLEHSVAQATDAELEDHPEDAPEIGQQDPEPLAPGTEIADPPVPAIGFASRRAERQKAEEVDGANRASAATVTAPVVPVDDTPQPAPPAPTVPAATAVLQEAAPEPQLTERSKPAKRNTPRSDAELERMTVFGARQSQSPAQPRVFGLVLTAGVLVFLAGFAAWASVFMNDGTGFTSLFGGRAPEVAETAPEPIETPDPLVQTAALDPDPVLTEEDSAVLDALSTPEQPAPPGPLTDAEVDAKYATDGIWTRAPEVPATPSGLGEADGTYLAGITPVSASADALALPPVASFATDSPLAKVASPAAAGTQFALDARGLVVPTPQGALSPDGILVYLGAPPAVPPATLARVEVAPVEEGLPTAELAGFRPQPRPSGLQERAERVQLGGLSRAELAGFRPQLRPASAQELAAANATAVVDTNAAVTEALAEPDPVATATRLAIAESLRPDMRPKSLSRPSQQAAPQAETRVASAAATIAPRAVTPQIPSRASVAKAATTENAINLRNINLIGVYGKPSNRRALVRLSSGRYKKVVVGDNIDGGVVSAIGDGELRYRKRGRDLVLRMPQ